LLSLEYFHRFRFLSIGYLPLFGQCLESFIPVQKGQFPKHHRLIHRIFELLIG